ncbi:MAG: hypothetical protein HYS38_10135 [Acidobacteria bacterium]|nr:hypothetical protein [Acidobacteriota bacterium]
MLDLRRGRIKMGDGVVVDACVMRQFNEDTRANTRGPAKLLVDGIADSLGFAVDEGRKIEQQWLTTCQGLFLQEWFISQLYHGHIRAVRPTIQEQHKKKLHLKLGFPPSGYDRVYIGVANVTQTRYIVSGDMDFYDPKLKQANENAKSRARDARCGAVCQYLKNKMKIAVGTITHALGELPLQITNDV